MDPLSYGAYPHGWQAGCMTANQASVVSAA
ncbi:hypothetical protein JOE53_001027 [Microbacterium laevaniformans]|nr:hypothetical protein [Microbacterium laevaniformans]